MSIYERKDLNKREVLALWFLSNHMLASADAFLGKPQQTPDFEQTCRRVSDAFTLADAFIQAGK